MRSVHVLNITTSYRGVSYTQSRSQSSWSLHGSPRQCPSQVHTASAALLVRDAVRVCRVSEVMVEDIKVCQRRTQGSFSPRRGSRKKRTARAVALSLWGQRRQKAEVLEWAAEGLRAADGNRIAQWTFGIDGLSTQPLLDARPRNPVGVYEHRMDHNANKRLHTTLKWRLQFCRFW